MIGKYFKGGLVKVFKIVKLLFFTRGVRLEMGFTKALGLALLIFISQFLDALSTKIGLKVGGDEANGVMSKLIGKYGIEGFFLFKGLVSLILAYFFWKRPTATLVVTGLYLLVVINNLVVIYRHLG